MSIASANATAPSNEAAGYCGRRAMWLEVLTRAIEDAHGRFGGQSEGLSVDACRRYIGSADFATVCDLAGMDPAFMAEAFRAGKFADGIKQDTIERARKAAQ